MRPDPTLLDHIAIVLVRPKYPENIGAAVRAAWNMGITRIIIVADEYPDHGRMAKMATRNAAHLLDKMEFHQNLAEALQPFSQVVGATARKGKQRIRANSPREVLNRISPLLPENQIAFLFGPEDSGLSNEDLQFCQLLSAIPTADFSSLNLAQAVAIHCYEIYHALIHEPKDIVQTPKLASSFELENMYSVISNTLLKVDLLDYGNQNYYMRKIRHFFGRIEVKSGEAKMIGSICRQFRLHASRKERTNREDSKAEP